VPSLPCNATDTFPPCLPNRPACASIVPGARRFSTCYSRTLIPQVIQHTVFFPCSLLFARCVYRGCERGVGVGRRRLQRAYDVAFTAVGVLFAAAYTVTSRRAAAVAACWRFRRLNLLPALHHRPSCRLKMNCFRATAWQRRALGSLPAGVLPMVGTPCRCPACLCAIP